MGNPSNKNKEGSAHQKILSFRIPASILESDVKEIVLPQECLNENYLASEQLCREGLLIDPSGEPGDHMTIRMENVGRSHLFTNTKSLAEGWQYSGSSKTSQRAFLQPANKDLKDFGNKARARLEEEKSKRPEIKMLDSAPTTETTRKRSKMTSFITAKTVKPTITRPTRKRKAISRQSPKQQRKTDEWSPDVSHIPVPPKESRSTLVKLHGLPVGCTLEHIKTFLTGLQPERILILLTNRADIPELDAFNASSLRESLKDRYGNSLRVFVKFESGPAAALASERSGETITMMDNADESPSSARKSFSIGVTQIRKEVATVLSTLSFSAVPGVAFHSTLSVVEKQLHPMVSKAIWAVAAREVGFAVSKEIRTANLLPNDEDPKTLLGYQRLAQHHNRLVEVHDELLEQLPFPSVEVDERDHSRNPVVQLTNAASKALIAEMERIQALLYQTRVSRRMGRKRD